MPGQSTVVRDGDSIAGNLHEELLRHIARQAGWLPIPVFIGAVLVFSISYDTAPRAGLITWLTGVFAVLSLRYVVLTRLPHRTDVPVRRRLHAAALLSGINGAMHGSAVVFFAYLVEFERFVVFMVILAFSAGAVSSTAGYRPVFLAYMVPTLTPIAVLWMVNFGGEVHWYHVFVGFLTLLHGGVLMRLAHEAFRLFRESFEIRLEHLELNRRLEQALEESRVANAAKTRFLAVASHDLRQPVHALALFSSSLSRRQLDERTREIAEHIETAIDMLSTQLDALLDISRLDAGIVKPNPRAFDLDRLLARLHEQFAPLAEEKGVELTSTCPPGTVVASDETLVEQVVRNLLGNAVKYTDTGMVSVAVTNEGQRTLLTIKDTGHGIPADAQPHVFEEFYQVDNPGRDRSRGLGLGLAIAKRLVDLLGLRLAMASAVGVGTAFTLELERAAVVRAAQPPAAPERVRLDRVGVLVVDDEPEVRAAMRLLLEDLGCRVDLAEGTADALRCAERARPDIVISDFRLRGDDNGLVTIRELRALYPGLPAVLVTGDSGPNRLRDAHEADVHLLHKPVRPEKLAATIHELCPAGIGAAAESASASGRPSGAVLI